MDGRFLEPIAADNWTDPAVRTIQITKPAAGAEFTQTVPGQSTWALVAICAQLVTSATVASRVPSLTFTDGTNTVAQVPVGANVTASLTTRVTWMADGASTSASLLGTSLIVNTPKLILSPGWTVASSTAAIDTADQYQNIVLTVIESLTGDKFFEAHLLERMLDKIDALQPNSLLPGS
jgi:hypothetical protein